MPKLSIKTITRNPLARFILSAGLGFTVDVSSFALLCHYAFTEKKYLVLGYEIKNTSLAVAISFPLGVIVNFLMTRYIVFTESRSRFSKQFFRFAMVAGIGFFATQFLLNFIITQLNFNPILARVITAFSLLFASFFIHKAFSFSLSLRHHATANPRSGN